MNVKKENKTQHVELGKKNKQAKWEKNTSKNIKIVQKRIRKLINSKVTKVFYGTHYFMGGL